MSFLFLVERANNFMFSCFWSFISIPDCAKGIGNKLVSQSSSKLTICKGAPTYIYMRLDVGRVENWRLLSYLSLCFGAKLRILLCFLLSFSCFLSFISIPVTKYQFLFFFGFQNYVN